MSCAPLLPKRLSPHASHFPKSDIALTPLSATDYGLISAYTAPTYGARAPQSEAMDEVQPGSLPEPIRPEGQPQSSGCSSHTCLGVSHFLQSTWAAGFKEVQFLFRPVCCGKAFHR